jgi:hypothetical protein
MSRRPALVSQADVARAIRAADQAQSPRVIEITPDGVIRIVPFTGQTPVEQPTPRLDVRKPIEL